MSLFWHPDATRKLNGAQWKEVNRRHHVQYRWVCGTPAGDGGYCHFPSWDFSCGVPRATHTPLHLSPPVSKEETQCVWPLSCGQWLGSHSQADSKQTSHPPGEFGSGHPVVREHPDIFEISQLRRSLYSCGQESKTWAICGVSAEANGHDISSLMQIEQAFSSALRNLLSIMNWALLYCDQFCNSHKMQQKNISHLIWKITETMLVSSEKLFSDTPKAGLQRKGVTKEFFTWLR